MSQERAKHPPVRLGPDMIAAVVDTLVLCAGESDWRIAAASIESTHTHLLLTYTRRNIDVTVKWIKDRATKAIHANTPHQGPVWCKGKWRSFVFHEEGWDSVRTYIELHNERRGVGMRPYPFLYV